MITIEDVCRSMQRRAPLRLAESWDNVGLLIGDPQRAVRRIMTCLTITPTTAAEAVQDQADLVIAHHPCPFHGVKRITTSSPSGRILLELLRAETAVYSAHTAFDSAAQGINQQIAEGLGLRDIVPLREHPEGLGAGRTGRLAGSVSLADLAERVKAFFAVAQVQMIGEPRHAVRRVAIACGAAGELAGEAIEAKCDAMILGETRLHTCLEAEASGLGLVMPGHHASERFAMEQLAESLRQEFADTEVWASRRERDPIQYV